MSCYLENIIVPLISDKGKPLKVDESHPALVLFDCFRLQTTTPETQHLLCPGPT